METNASERQESVRAKDSTALEEEYREHFTPPSVPAGHGRHFHLFSLIDYTLSTYTSDHTEL